MDFIYNLLRTDAFLLVILVVLVILIILYITNLIKLRKINENYIKFVKKIGNGNNIDEMLKEYINSVENVQKTNKEIVNYCENIDKKVSTCIQKIGIVRYNAFKDTGSDLSFSLAILDDYNNGVVLNGIYARDSSNIYAKPVENGASKYVLSNEEKEAINRAINNIK